MKKYFTLLFVLALAIVIGCTAKKKTVKDVATDVKDTTVEVAKKAGEGTKDAATKVAEGTKNTTKKVAEGTKNAATKVADGTKNTAKKVGEGTKNAATKVADGTKKAVNKTGEVAKDAGGAVKDAAVKVVGKKTPGLISFEAANERYSAEGKFNKWHFTKVEMKGQEITTLSADLEIDLTSIWEKSDKLTEHLKAPDYFDVAKYTTATLSLDNVQPKGDAYEADMVLKMRDTMQELKSEFEVVTEDPLTVKGTAMVDRSIFGIGVENKGVPDLIKVSYETVVK